MSGETTTTYHRHYSKCGKENCHTCRDGLGHGPYWYAYRMVNGRTKQTYIGKTLPPDTSPFGRHHEYSLLGRSQEMDRLRALLDSENSSLRGRGKGRHKSLSASSASAGCIVLTGEAGIGKTRLLEAFVQEAQVSQWLVVWARAVVQEHHLPYTLWSEVVRKVLLVAAGQHELERDLPLYRPLNVLIPELHTLHTGVERLVSAEQEQLLLWEAVRALLSSVAKVTPLLIVLDDLQWADGRSCELFAYLVRRISGPALRIVGTCREHEMSTHHVLGPLLAELQRERVAEIMALPSLSREQIATLVAQTAQPARIVTQQTIERIQEQAKGNPFFAEELTRSVVGSDEKGPLPSSIAAVLDLRLARLSTACQSLLGKAAVLGDSFELPLILAMESSSTQQADENALLLLLEEALAAGMLTEETRETHITYHFWHPLLVSRLYERLSAARRASLHRRAADILSDRVLAREEERAALITHHLVLGGGDEQRIVHFARLAGDGAYALSAYPDAATFYQIAIEHLDLQARVNGDVMTDLLEKLGECLKIQGYDEQARHAYERIFSLRSLHQGTSAEHVDDAPDVQREALLYCEVGWTWYASGNTQQTVACCQRGEQLLTQAHIREGVAWAAIRFQQSYVSWQQGAIDRAISLAHEAQRLFSTRVEEHASLPITSRSLTRTQRTLAGNPLDRGKVSALLGSLFLVSGHLSAAVEQLQRALEIFEQSSSLREIATVCCTLSDIYLRRAAYKEAGEVLTRSLLLAERIGDVPLLSVIYVNLGILALRQEQLLEAETWLQRGVVLAQQIHDSMYESLFHAYLAPAFYRQHKNTQARSHLASALRIAHSLQSTLCLSVAFVALAEYYITYARTTQIEDEHHQVAPSRLLHWLHHAQDLLYRIIHLHELEVEVHVEAQVHLAEVALLLGNRQQAHQQALTALDAAQQNDLIWLLARVHSLVVQTADD